MRSDDGKRNSDFQREREFRDRERRWQDREKHRARDRSREQDNIERERERRKAQKTRAEATLISEYEKLAEGKREVVLDRERRRNARLRVRRLELQTDADDRRREQEDEVNRAKKQRQQEEERQHSSVAAAEQSQAPAAEHVESKLDGGTAAVGPIGPALPVAAGTTIGPAIGPQIIGPVVPETTESSASDRSVGFGIVAKQKAKTSEVDRKPKPIFTADDDTDNKKRKLVKLEYSAAELTGSSQLANDARSAAAAAAAAINQRRKGEIQASETAQQRAQRLIGCVPKDKETLYAMEVDWDILVRNRPPCSPVYLCVCYDH